MKQRIKKYAQANFVLTVNLTWKHTNVRLDSFTFSETKNKNEKLMHLQNKKMKTIYLKEFIFFQSTMSLKLKHDQRL